jgi:hypothetical protein
MANPSGTTADASALHSGSGNPADPDDGTLLDQLRGTFRENTGGTAFLLFAA